MKSATNLFLGVCLTLVAGLGYFFFNQTGAAQKQSHTQWEYAAIVSSFSFHPTKERTNKIPGVALVCYLQNSGCRFMEVKHELDYTVYLQDRLLPLVESNQTRLSANARASEIAFQKAVAQLGGEGWEMVSEPHLDFESIDYEQYLKLDDKSVFFNRSNTRAVYFKRLKTQ